MRIDIITIFPKYFESLKVSLLGKAIDSGVLDINIVNLRDYAHPPHYNVDDTPYGGGTGMIMRVDILAKALDSVVQSADGLEDDSATSHFKARKIIFTSPAGMLFNQQMAHCLAGYFVTDHVNAHDTECDTAQINDTIAVTAHVNAHVNAHKDQNTHLIFICGRFEGYDARILDYCNAKFANSKTTKTEVMEVSIGNYVLFGGEVAVLVMIEAIARLIPGVIGNPESLLDESHEINVDGDTLLEYPLYTRPRDFANLEVPEVLLSGNHAKIESWRLEAAKQKTQQNSAKNTA